jgi:aminotransferase in exopolysaccharide biosynthesis
MNLNEFVNFTRDLFKTKEFIPLHEPVFFGNEKKYVNDTLDSSIVSSIGPYVNFFEKELSRFLDINYSVAFVNGTSALQVALRVAGVKEKSEVITQALTFVATANSIKYLYADPIFIDVDIDTMSMSPISLNKFLDEYGDKRDDGTYNKKTGNKISACVPMHTFGFMSRIDQILKICKKWDIPVVEDAAEALGSKFNGKPAGSFGLVSAFSFNGNKIITSGGGGAICSNNKHIAEISKHLSTTAKRKHKWEYFHDQMGYNFRMPNINAALILAQLENFKKIIENKKSLYKNYQSFFTNNNLKLCKIPPSTDWNYWLISICLENKEHRDFFLKYTNDNNVMTRPIWTLLYKLPMYKNSYRDDQKNAIFLEERIVNVPSSYVKANNK